MVTRRDWTELNPELLHLIANKLGTLSNFIRFRSVCKQWRAAADPAYPPPQLPWLLQPATLTQTHTHTNTHGYILSSLFYRSTSHIQLPIHHREYRYYSSKEPSIGFILANAIVQNLTTYPYLYNPLTGNQIHLSFTKHAKYNLVCLSRSNKSNSSMIKPGVHLIVFAHMRGLTEIGSWSFDTNKFLTFYVPFRTFVVGYYKGKVFVHDEAKTRKTSVFDVTTGAEMNVVIPHPAECLRFNFFVEAMRDLLAVGCPNQGEGGCHNHQLNVYRLDHTKEFGQCRWIKLKGIGERVLFLGRRPGGICLSASDFEGLRGNCIYYMQGKMIFCVIIAS